MVKEKPVMVRTSERTQFAHCRQRWHWAYVEQMRPKESRFNALVFGDLVHRALAAYYVPETARKRRRGPHPAQTYLRLYDALADQTRTGRMDLFVDDTDEKFVDARELGEEMMTNYIDEFGKDERYLVLYPEMPFQIDLKDGRGRVVCTYVGTSDALIKDLETNRLGLFEHKTAAAIDTSHLFLDEQASTYWAIVPLWLRENGILPPDEDMDFMLYNFMRKGKKDQRPRNEQGQCLNKDGSVSKNQPAALFKRELVFRGPEDRYSTYDRILAQVHEMNMVRSGDLEVYKAPSKDCRFCEFRDVCELHEQRSNWEELLHATFRKWEPYKDHVWSLNV